MSGAELVGIIYDLEYSVDYSGNSPKPKFTFYVYDENKNIHEIEYTSFRPYFLVETTDFADRNMVKNEIKSMSNVIGIEEVVKKDIDTGKNKELIKVITRLPRDVTQLRKDVIEVSGVKTWHEADIKFKRRFLVDEDVRFVKWTKIGFDVINRRGNRVKKLRSMSDIEYLRDAKPSELNLKMCTLDIEVHNPDKGVEPESDRMIIINMMVGRVLDGKEPKKFRYRLDDYNGRKVDKERKLSRDVINTIVDEDPQLINTYNGTSFDLWYFNERTKHLGVDMSKISKDDNIYFKDIKSPNTTKDKVLYISGRINYDAYVTAKRDVFGNDHTLEGIAEQLGVIDREERVEMKGGKIHEYWDIGGFHRDLLDIYCMYDVEATWGISEDNFYRIATSISQVVNIPLSDSVDTGYGSIDAQYLNNEYNDRGYILPKKSSDTEENVKGAEVVNRIEDGDWIYDVECLDFSSMYPSIIIFNNISHETILHDGIDYNGEINVSPDGNYRCKADVDAVLPQVAQDWMDTRSDYKKKYKELPENHPDKGYYDTLQYTFKRLANTLYGMTGAKTNRYYSPKIANYVTEYGRHATLTIFDIANEEFDKNAYYGDTDSAYLDGFEDEDVREEYTKRVEEETGLEIELDYIVPVIVFLGKKKQYFFLKRERDGDLSKVVKGLETRRGDALKITSEIMSEAIDRLLMEVLYDKEDDEPNDDLNKFEIQEKTCDIVEKISDVITKIRNGDVSVEELLLESGMSKALEDYDDTRSSPHVSAVKRELDEYGKVMDRKGKVGYYVVKADKITKYYPNASKIDLEHTEPDKVSERTVHHSRIDDDYYFDLDIEYYVGDRIVKPLYRIFKIFGFTSDRLGYVEKSLDDIDEKVDEIDEDELFEL